MNTSPMLDHIFLSVGDTERSAAFRTAAPAPLGIAHPHDHAGRDGAPGHPDASGFGSDGRVFFWLREGVDDGHSLEFVRKSRQQVQA